MSVDKLAFESAAINNEIVDCKGLIFRGRVSTYQTSKGLATTSKLDLLKRRSCSGCSKCSWIWDNFAEDLSDGTIQLPEIVDGKDYELRVTYLGRDYWTGEYEGYEIDFKVLL